MRGRLYTGSFAVVLLVAMLVMTGCPKKPLIDVSGLTGGNDLDFGALCNDFTKTFTVTNAGGGTLKWSADKSDDDWFEVSPSLPTSGKLKKNKSVDITVTVKPSKLPEGVATAGIITLSASNKGVLPLSIRVLAKKVCVQADTVKPVITLLGVTPVTVAVGSVYTDAGATASDNVDGDITANIVATSTVNTAAVGTYTVTYNVSDAAGNAATPVVRTVNVTDQTAPVITLLGTNPVTVAVGSVYTDAGATALDNVDGNITANIVATSTVNTAVVGTYTVTYNVSDAAGNAATPVVRTVNVTDQTAPVITLLGVTPVTVALGSVYTDAGATAVDNVDGNITANIVATSTVNTAVVGTYTVTYNVSDAAGNAATPVVRTVNVTDQTAPVITLLGANPATVAVGSVYGDAGATALDDVDGNITANIVVGGLPIDTSAPGTHTVTYNVSDAAGNAAVQVTRTVNVTDQTAPVITLLGVTPVTVAVGSVYTDAGATAVDNVDGNITANIVATSTVNTAVVGTYTVTYNVSDAAGNAATPVVRTVNVTDQTAPVITLLGANPVTVAVNSVYTDAGATAVDNVDGNITADIVVGGLPVDTSVLGDHLVTYDVSDAAGNAAVQVTRTVRVVPIFITPSAATLIEGDTVVLAATSGVGDTSYTWDVVDGTVASLSTVGVLYNEVQVTALPRLNGLEASTNVNVTGDQSNNTASALITVMPNVVTVDPPSATIEVGQTVTLVATTLSQNDTFIWGTSNPAIAVVAAGAVYNEQLVTGVAAGGPVDITATGSATNRSATSAITVTKTTPTVTFPSSATPIAAGHTLSESILSSDGSALNPWTGAPVAGTFAFADPGFAPPEGNYTAAVVFTPADTANYNSVTGTVIVPVSGGVVISPPAAEVFEGDQVQLTAMSAVTESSFTWQVLAPAVVSLTRVADEIYTVTGLHLDSDSNTQTQVQATGDTSGNFGLADILVKVSAVTVTPPVAAIEVGQTIQLTASSLTQRDDFGWGTSNGLVATVVSDGIYTATVTAQGAGSADITATGTASGRSDASTITVNKATPTVTFPTSSSIFLGQTLASSVLTGGSAINPHTGATVSGTFAFADPSIEPAQLGNYAADVVFTPADTANYNSVTGTVVVAVEEGVFVTPNSASIYEGDRIQLTPGSNAGDTAFDWAVVNPAVASIEEVGEIYTWVTALHRDDDLNASTSVTVTGATSALTAAANIYVLVNTVTVSPAGPITIEVGQTTTLSATTNTVSDTFTWQTVGTAVSLAAGAIYNEQAATGLYAGNTVTVTATGTASQRSGSVDITVAKATPVVTWPTASMVYGQTLSQATIIGGSATNPHTGLPVPGGFEFASPNDVPAVTTAQPFVAMFVPADSDNYNQVPGEILVTVVKADPVVTWPTASLGYGQTLADAVQTGGAGDGVFTFVAPTTAPAVADSGTAYAAIFTPTDTVNYNSLSGTIVVTVNKATPVVIWPTAAAYMSQTLADAVLTGGSAANPFTLADVPGTFPFDAPATVLSVAGTQIEPATFTPTDTANYETVPGTVTVTVSNPVSVAPVAATLYEGCTVDLTATSALASDTTFTWAPLVSTAVSLTGAGDLYTVTALHQDSDTDTAEQVIVTGDASGGSATADITVLVNTVTVTPAGPLTIEVGETVTLTATTLAVCDDFLWNTVTTVATVTTGALYNEGVVTGVAAGEVSITATGTASGRTSDPPVVVTVAKATPSIVAPTGSIVCGDTLADAVFTGGSAVNPHTGLPVAGTWVFDSPGDAPTASATFVATFAPVEDANYNAVPTLIDVTVIPALEILSVNAPGAGGNGATGEDAAPNGNVLKAFTVGVYADQGAHMDSSLLAPEEILPSGGWATVDANDALDIYYYGESDTTGIPNLIVSWVADECNPDFYRPQAFGSLSASFAKVAGQAVVNVVGIYTMESCTAVYTPLGDSSFPNIIDFNLGCVAK